MGKLQSKHGELYTMYLFHLLENKKVVKGYHKYLARNKRFRRPLIISPLRGMTRARVLSEVMSKQVLLYESKCMCFFWVRFALFFKFKLCIITIRETEITHIT